ncbi:MAG: hypothetical protein E7214_06305 [Clostridium sp.]|nr:hypothetical protein [Clostridium sp.]
MKFSLKYPKYKELGIGITILTLFTLACSITVIVQSIDLIRIKNTIDVSNIPYSQVYSELISCIFFVISSILILYKKKSGVILYAILCIVSLAINIIFNGIHIFELFRSFLSSIILLLFIYRKRELYFN